MVSCLVDGGAGVKQQLRAAVVAFDAGSEQRRVANLLCLVEGGVGDVCVFDPLAHWQVQAANLRSQGKHTPFSGYELPGRVRWTFVGGHLAYEAPLV